MKKFCTILFFATFLGLLNGFRDYTLACRPGYKLVGLSRVNSVYQRGIAGSLNVECQQILRKDLEQVIYKLNLGKVNFLKIIYII